MERVDKVPENYEELIRLIHDRYDHMSKSDHRTEEVLRQYFHFVAMNCADG